MIKNYAPPSSQPLYVIHMKRGVLSQVRRSFSHCLTQTVTNQLPLESVDPFSPKFSGMVVTWNEMSEIVNSRVYHNETSVTSLTIYFFIKISIYTDELSFSPRRVHPGHIAYASIFLVYLEEFHLRTVAWPGSWVALALQKKSLCWYQNPLNPVPILCTTIAS